jgi:hypothetical protein
MVTKVKIRKSKRKYKSNRKIAKLLNKKKTMMTMRGGSVGQALSVAGSLPPGAAQFLKENPGIKKIEVSSLSKLAPDLPTGPSTPEQKQQQQLELLKALQEVARRGGQGQQGEIEGLKGLGVPGQSNTFTVSPALAKFGVNFAAKHGSTAFSLARGYGISDNDIKKEVSSALPHVKLPPGMNSKSVMNIVEKSRQESLLASDPKKAAALASDTGTGTLKRKPGMIDTGPLKTTSLAPGSLKTTSLAPGPLKTAALAPGASSFKKSGKTPSMSSPPKMKF